ncbi:MAG: Rne/Rng family ribonuclease [bacterium]|nr:Rne/Rng family ribonuclease [bacterium]
MEKKLILNDTRNETRVALLEEGVLAEFYVERGSDSSILGNIYKGRINRVLPGMQAAFVDIGLERAAFLYVADVLGASREPGESIGDRVSDSIEDLPGISTVYKPPHERAEERYAPIDELLVEGQEILVQVTKEPIGTKGARVTSYISLPGRYLVYMPGAGHVGISRKIENEAERQRLKNIVASNIPEGEGFIIRTASMDADEGELKSDMKSLLKMWDSVKLKEKKARPMSLVHQDIDITLRAIRDMLSPDITEVVIDSPEGYEKIMSFMKDFMISMKGKVTLYEQSEPIFDHYDIEIEIDDILGEKVWLKSGGYIIIETTEALTVIDVNTGKFTGKKNLEDTILKTNLESAREVAYQLRLRNIGGIIIIDFIDMMRQEDKDKVYNTLEEALKKDRSVTRLTEISDLGLLEMTRKRIRNNIVKVMCKPCEYCEGRGYLKSKESISLDILRCIEKESLAMKAEEVIVQVHPEISDILLDSLFIDIEELEKKCATAILIKPVSSLHMEDYHINLK